MAYLRSLIFVCLLALSIRKHDAAPIPPRLPLSDRENHPVMYHVKEESPVKCSRSVSSWVREAWRIVAADVSRVHQGFTIAKFLSPSCPLKDDSGDMYIQQERNKAAARLNGVHRCSVCNKTFRSEYYLDRHLDRRHLFPDLQLPDDYRGGPIKYVKEISTNTTLPAEKVLFLLRPQGLCLEDYCQIFDVCDRPPARRYPVIGNNLSMTYQPVATPAVKRNGKHQTKSIKIRDGECRSKALPFIFKKCIDLVDGCLSLGSPISEVRTANIYIKRNLCESLEKCDYYLTRRQYSGSKLKYTEDAYLGRLIRPITAMPVWQVSLFVVTSISAAFVVITTICCYLEGQSSRESAPRFEKSRSFAYDRSVVSKTAPFATRRRVTENREHPPFMRSGGV